MPDPSLRLRDNRTDRNNALSIHDGPAIWMQDLSGHVGGIIGCQKDKARRNFLRLTGTAEWNIRTERLDFFRGICRWNNWRPNWTRCDAVHANAFGPRLRKRMREDGDRAFARAGRLGLLRAKAVSAAMRELSLTREHFFEKSRFHG